MKKTVVFIILLLLVVSVTAGQKEKVNFKSFSASIDNSTYIDANYLLMFISNYGVIGRDLGGMFSSTTLYDNPGTFYPYTSIENIINKSSDNTVLYSAGCWLGGKVNDTIRVSVAEYSSEFVPGPMVDSTFLPDDPSYKIYKLYADSMESNPNDDYLNWPVAQGAPVDAIGHPRLYGDQTLWAVFNDADSTQHDNMRTLPLGIEVQLTAWAEIDEGDDTLFRAIDIPLDYSKSSKNFIDVNIVDTAQLTGHTYSVITGNDGSIGAVWSLVDVTLDSILLDRIPFSRANILSDVVDGFQIRIIDRYSDFDQIQVVANGNGPLDPPESGAAGFAGFPTPTDRDPGGNPTDDQQVGPAKWLLHVLGGSNIYGCGTRDSYDDWLNYFRWDEETDFVLRQYDWEIRFTGSYDNPGVGGSYAQSYSSNGAYWVPFELWRVGVGTFDDPSDDLKCFFIMRSYASDTLFNLESFGSCLDTATCINFNCDHEVSDGYDDPYTDYLLGMVPGFHTGVIDDISGDSAYLEFEKYYRGITPNNYESDEVGLFRRMVFVSWDGGTEPPFSQEIPEQGTIFRITTIKEIPIDTISFTATMPQLLTSGPEGTSIYMMYKLYNKGINEIDSCYFSLWSDADVGTAGDERVSCDTLDNLFFAYNGDNDDAEYGSTPPAIGFKFIHGPLVPAPGKTANFENNIITDYQNLEMSSFFSFIGGLDPDDEIESYDYMKGLDAPMQRPYVYNGDTITFQSSGDPVTGTGDLGYFMANTRMMATCGPFDFNPGDSQYVLIKMTVGQGSDNLSSITKLREILNRPFSYYPTDIDDITPSILPDRFELAQNYPNPFNPTTTISYRLPTKTKVTLEIFNILGQKVTTLVDAEQIAGTYKIEWNGTNEAGDHVTTGIYLYRLTTDKFEETKKMMLLK